MKNKILLYFCVAILFSACGQNKPETKQKKSVEQSSGSHGKVIKPNREGSTIASRFSLPEGYQRVSVDSTSFANYLRTLPLKKAGSEVTYYDGTRKPNRNVYDAVIDLPIGKRDLHQCADAVMRLRAEYFFKTRKFDSIHFNFTNGFKADYANWRKGNRIIVNGNQVSWRPQTQPSVSDESFWKYLEKVFSYAGTASLEKEMKSISIEEMQIGAVFIKGGFPGHAVIVVDMAIHTETKEKIFLLAQSYMPAQEIQILKNRNNLDLSPWYSTKIDKELRTPEWTFAKTDLKRFSD